MTYPSHPNSHSVEWTFPGLVCPTYVSWPDALLSHVPPMLLSPIVTPLARHWHIPYEISLQHTATFRLQSDNTLAFQHRLDLLLCIQSRLCLVQLAYRRLFPAIRIHPQSFAATLVVWVESILPLCHVLLCFQYTLSSLQCRRNRFPSWNHPLLIEQCFEVHTSTHRPPSWARSSVPLLSTCNTSMDPLHCVSFRFSTWWTVKVSRIHLLLEWDHKRLSILVIPLPLDNISRILWELNRTDDASGPFDHVRRLLSRRRDASTTRTSQLTPEWCWSWSR